MAHCAKRGKSTQLVDLSQRHATGAAGMISHGGKTLLMGESGTLVPMPTRGASAPRWCAACRHILPLEEGGGG